MPGGHCRPENANESRGQGKGRGEAACKRLFMEGSELLSETNLFFVRRRREERVLLKQGSEFVPGAKSTAEPDILPTAFTKSRGHKVPTATIRYPAFPFSGVAVRTGRITQPSSLFVFLSVPVKSRAVLAAPEAGRPPRKRCKSRADSKALTRGAPPTRWDLFFPARQSGWAFHRRLRTQRTD